jgi:hypothetical protein
MSKTETLTLALVKQRGSSLNKIYKQQYLTTGSGNSSTDSDSVNTGSGPDYQICIPLG